MERLRPGSWALIQGGLIDVERAFSVPRCMYCSTTIYLLAYHACSPPSTPEILHIRSSWALKEKKWWYLGGSRVRHV